MSTHNIPILYRRSKRLLLNITISFLTWCHDLPSVARINVHGPKDVRTIEVLLNMSIERQMKT